MPLATLATSFQIFRFEHIGVGARVALFDKVIRTNRRDAAVFVHVIRVEQVDQRHFGHFFSALRLVSLND